MHSAMTCLNRDCRRRSNLPKLARRRRLSNRRTSRSRFPTSPLRLLHSRQTLRSANRPIQLSSQIDSSITSTSRSTSPSRHRPEHSSLALGSQSRRLPLNTLPTTTRSSIFYPQAQPKCRGRLFHRSPTCRRSSRCRRRNMTLSTQLRLQRENVSLAMNANRLHLHPSQSLGDRKSVV